MKLIKIPVLWLTSEEAEIQELIGESYSPELITKDVYFTSIDGFYKANKNETVIFAGSQEFTTNLSIEELTKLIENGRIN